MYHLTLNNRPICQHDPEIPCEYATRRESYSVAAMFHGLGYIEVHTGPCPCKFMVKV